MPHAFFWALNGLVHKRAASTACCLFEVCERDHYVHFLLYVIKLQHHLLYFHHNSITTKWK